MSTWVGEAWVTFMRSWVSLSWVSGMVDGERVEMLEVNFVRWIACISEGI